MQNYDPLTIEKKWQIRWQKNKTFEPDLEKAKKPFGKAQGKAQGKPFYNLMMFPYPSAEGLHVGHTYAFGGADSYGRFMRLKGFNVFEPMGFDAFGIHSENFAIKKGLHPRDLIAKTTAYFREEQMKRYGGMWDWSREVDTTDPEYYKWTQWIFVTLFKNGLAERKISSVNWCPSCKTVLSDEQVERKQLANSLQPSAVSRQPSAEIDVCERCKTEVERKKLKQWFFKITDYAQKLLDYHGSKWPETTRQMQVNWIGKSEGINIEYEVENNTSEVSEDFTSEVKDTSNIGAKLTVTCFTTRPDTNFGATFIVLAPENPLIDQITSKEYKKAVSNYVSQALKKSEQERKAEERKKTGVFTGAYAINNLNGKKLPIWVSDFVLMDVGTGAVVGVPGHDKRDFEFARTFALRITRVVVGPDGDTSAITKISQVQEDTGHMINSDFLNGLDIHQATEKIMAYLEEKGWGKRVTTYKLRDWCISRQRYWGPPIPMIYCSACADRGESWFTTQEAKQPTAYPANGGANSKLLTPERRLELAQMMAGWYPVEEKDLPVLLPFIKDYQPKGEGVSPLAQDKAFVKVKCPRCGQVAKRETDVSDTFLDSAWYFFRYPSMKIQNRLVNRTPGVSKSLTPGVRQSPGVRLPFNPEITKKWLPVDIYIGGNEHACLHLMYSRFITKVFYDLGLIDFKEPFKRFFSHGLIIKDGAKMSKSRGNVVNPIDYMDKYGADALRMYLLFIGPYENGGDFRDTGMTGMYKFLARLYRLSDEAIKNRAEMSPLLKKKLHQTIQKMEKDLSSLRFNTAIASLMELTNAWQKEKKTANKELVSLVSRLIAPLAPHLAEELWQMADGKFSVLDAGWPAIDKCLVQEENIEIVVQVNGKLRDRIKLLAKSSQNKEKVLKLALASERVQKHLKGRQRRVIFIPARLINLVTSS